VLRMELEIAYKNSLAQTLTDANESRRPAPIGSRN
jgi:hypothetical protein